MAETGDAVPLTELARAHGGVLLTAQAMACGWPQRRLNRRLVSDGWTRIRTGAWLEPGRVLDEMVLLHANQAGRPQLVVSHTAAAVLHDIETRTQRVEFTAPRGVSATVHGGVLHKMRLGEEETTTVDGLRATTVVRTMADPLRAGPRDDALVAVESAVSRRPSRYGGGRGRRAPPGTVSVCEQSLAECHWGVVPHKGFARTTRLLTHAKAHHGGVGGGMRLRMNNGPRPRWGPATRTWCRPVTTRGWSVTRGGGVRHGRWDGRGPLQPR